jgi:hypothetical protein
VGDIDLSLHGDMIGLGDLKFWMRQSLSQLAVVGQQHQAFAATIQATHRKQSLSIRNEIDHARPPLRIRVGRNDSNRFVNRVVDRLETFEWFAINTNLVGRWIDLEAQLISHFAVDLDTPLGDELITSAATTQTSSSENLVKTLLTCAERTPARRLLITGHQIKPL